jgi:glutamate-1-semialdehyde 2,1-aminomutase
MDAVHLARALTGRDLIIKVEGCYHGHHDSVQVSVLPDADEVGPREYPTPVPGNSGIPGAIRDLVIVVPFNDVGAVARALAEHRGQVAAMILEPVMMNAGIIPPEDGYLAVIRDLVHGEGAFLIYDEVKTGFTTGPGGITARNGVVPDIVCLAKALGGGISVAAIGGTSEVMKHVADGEYEMVGTFNGNPLAMAATRAMLLEVATADAYRRIEALRKQAVDGVSTAIARHGLAASVVSIGAKGCIVFSAEPVRDFRGFLGINDAYSPANWLFQHNGCIPPAMGEGGAMAVVGSARLRRCRPVRRELRPVRGRGGPLNRHTAGRSVGGTSHPKGRGTTGEWQGP